MISYQWLNGTDDLSEAYAVRLAVFCDEQGYSYEAELDETDKTSWHIIVKNDRQTVATGRLYTEQPGTFRLGRIAVLKSQRGKGLGMRVVELMEEKARTLGARCVELDAQCRAIGFYEKAGYTVHGEEHMDGHVPHKMMKKEL